MGALFELVLELLLNGLGEVLVDVFAILEEGRQELHPVTRFVLLLTLGAVLGRSSVWLFPNLFIHSPTLREWNLIAAPVFVGTVSWLMSALRQRAPGARAIAAAVFALAFASVRLHAAETMDHGVSARNGCRSSSVTQAGG